MGGLLGLRPLMSASPKSRHEKVEAGGWLVVMKVRQKRGIGSTNIPSRMTSVNPWSVL